MSRKKSLYEMEETRLKYGKYKTFTIVLNGTCMYLLDISAFAAVIFSLLFQKISIGTAAALLSYIKEFTYPIRSLISGISEIKSTRAVKEGIFSILAYQPRSLEVINELKSSLDFYNVCIRWDHFELDHFTFSFKKGKKYAIIGHSGSGKSTLFQLLAQRVIPSSGIITIDGHPLENIDYTSIAAYITQNEHIYDAGFEENVTVFHSYLQNSLKDMIAFMENSRIETLSKKMTVLV